MEAQQIVCSEIMLVERRYVCTDMCSKKLLEKQPCRIGVFVQHLAAEAVDVNEIEIDYEPEQASQWLLSFVCAYSAIQEHERRLRMKADA